LQEKKCIMAVDEGRKRVGIALTDESGQIAFPYKTVDKISALQTIISIIKEKHVKSIVIGLPFNVDGSKGFRYNETIQFAKALKKRSNLPIIGVDERYSTEEAKELMNEYPGKRVYDIDAIEAFIILKRFLNNEKTYSI